MSLGTDSVLDTLVHTSLLDSISSRVHLASVDIQVNTPTQAADGEQVDSWADHATMINIPGTLAKSGMIGTEQRRLDLTVSRSTLILDLAGYYPDITDEHRVNLTTPDNGRTEVWNIMQVLHDSQAQQTRLELEEVAH